MNIGIIGYGNIGELLTQNILGMKKRDFDMLYISNRHISKIESLNDNDSVICTDSNVEVAKNCEKIIISVKTPDFFEVIDGIYPHINENTHITFCCAGVDNRMRLEKYPDSMTCVIPTIASTYDGINAKKGVSLIHHDSNVSDENRKYIENLFSGFSDLRIVENEENLEILTLATSCMPAYIAFCIDKFASQLALKSDISKDEFMKLLLNTNISASQLLNEDIYDSSELIGKVATKNGITQKGLDYLEEELSELYGNLITKVI